RFAPMIMKTMNWTLAFAALGRSAPTTTASTPRATIIRLDQPEQVDLHLLPAPDLRQHVPARVRRLPQLLPRLRPGRAFGHRCLLSGTVTGRLARTPPAWPTQARSADVELDAGFGEFLDDVAGVG